MCVELIKTLQIIRDVYDDWTTYTDEIIIWADFYIWILTISFLFVFRIKFWVVW